MSEKQRLELTIFGEQLKLRVEAGEAARLRKAAEYVEGKLAPFRGGAATPNVRAAILAALEIAHELVQEREGAGPEATRRQRETVAVGAKLESLIDMLDGELGKK